MAKFLRNEVIMSYTFPQVKQNSDGNFGPTKENHFYIPVSYHNKTAAPRKDKTTWILKKNEQFEAFKVSDEKKWFCQKKNGLFSILDGGNVIMGSNEERLSFFPNPVNPGDPFHGFPISSGEYELSISLVDQWLNDNIIDVRLHIKILKGQI